MNKPLPKTLEKLITDLFATDADKVMAALEKVPGQGRTEVIFPLLRAYQSWTDEPLIQGKVRMILYELKSESAVQELVKAMVSKEFIHERALIISAFWNSGLIPHEHVKALIDVAIEGDFLVAFEVLTVLEQIENFDDNELIQDCALDIQEYVDAEPDAPNVNILLQIKDLLENNYTN